MPKHPGSHTLPKPQKAKGTRKKIKATAPPGGNQTPGAKARAEAQNTDSNNKAR